MSIARCPVCNAVVSVITEPHVSGTSAPVPKGVTWHLHEGLVYWHRSKGDKR